MSGRKKTVIISIVFCIIVVVSFFYLEKVQYKSAIGTFCTGDGISKEDVYITIYSDNTFLLYQQFEILSEGAYEKENIDGVEVLYLKKKDGTIVFAVYDNNDSLSLMDSTSNTKKLNFKRISDTPLEINISRLD